MKALRWLLFIAAGCCWTPAFTNAQTFNNSSKLDFSFRRDFRGDIQVGSNCSGQMRFGDSILKGAEIKVGSGTTRFTIKIKNDLEGAIVIADRCDVVIEVGDSFNKTGKVVVGNASRVRIISASHVRGELKVGKKSEVTVEYEDSNRLRIEKDIGSTVTLKKEK